MNTRRAVFGAALAVGFGVVGRRMIRSRARPAAAPSCAPSTDSLPSTASRGGRLRLVVALLLWPAVLLGYPWDPIIDFGDRAWNAVKDKVRELIDSVVGFFLDMIGVMGTFVARLGIVGVNVFRALENIADSIIPSVLDTVGRWLDNVYSWADARLRDVGWVAAHALDVANDIGGRLGGIIQNALVAAIDNFWRNVVAPIQRAVDAVWDRVWPFVRDVIATFWRDVVGPIGDLARAGWDAANRALDFAGWFMSQLYPVLQGAWHFLVFVATHPFDWWIRLADDAFRRFPEWFADHMFRAVQESGDLVDDRLSRWIAG